MNRSRRTRDLLLTVLFSALLFQTLSAGQSTPDEPPNTPIDLFLIIDTSATMVGKAGGQNIFPDVKRALKELVEACGPGDNIILIPYDADVRARATAVIYDKQDKAAIRAKIDALNAPGLWTYTAAAIQKGLEEARRLDEAQGTGKHPKVVILLTDGKNEPPPAIRGSAAEVRLNEVARRFQGMPWFVWQVQLGPTIDVGVDEAFRSAGFQNYRPVRTAAADLNRVRADILKEVEAEKARQAAERAAAAKLAAQADEDARRAMEEARNRNQAEASRRAEAEAKEREAARLQAEAANRVARQRKTIAAVGIAVLVLAAFVIVFLRRRPRPHGSLQYWKPGEAPRAFDIAAARKRRLRLGPADGDFALAGLGERGLTLSATRIDGQVLCVVDADDGVSLTFRGKSVNRLELYDRDQFQLGEHVFQYGEK